MFLIRTVFWLSLVIFLLPIGDKNSSNVIGVTAEAFGNSNHFCERNRDVCNITQEAWKSLKFKAAYSFDTVANLARDIKNQAEVGNSYAYDSTKPVWKTGNLSTHKQSKQTLSASEYNTLTTKDLEVEWSLEGKKTHNKPST